MRQRNKHLPPALSDTADVVLHNGDLARKAVLITQPLEYPLRCVTLLLRTILILFQDTVDNTDERIELRADRRPRPDITRWHRIAQHLPDRARVDPKTTSRFALAQTLNHYRVANPPIQFHSLHPPPFAPKCKGLSLTEFCSGATRLSGRFSEGLLLRRSQGVNLQPADDVSLPFLSAVTMHISGMHSNWPGTPSKVPRTVFARPSGPYSQVSPGPEGKPSD